MNIAENLVPALKLFEPVYIGSEAFTSATEMRAILWGLCQASRWMNGIVTPYLYQAVFVLDANKLACLQRTLEEDSEMETPELCRYIESLAVHQNIVSPGPGQERHMSVDGFSTTIYSILQKLPRLSRFSLVPIQMEVIQCLHPPNPRPAYIIDSEIADLRYLTGRKR